MPDIGLPAGCPGVSGLSSWPLLSSGLSAEDIHAFCLPGDSGESEQSEKTVACSANNGGGLRWQS